MKKIYLNDGTCIYCLKETEAIVLDEHIKGYLNLGVNIKNGDTIIDINYGPQSEDVSVGSMPDGLLFSNEWTLSMCPSPGDFNLNCPLVEGCTSINATNYNIDATIENGSCVFETIEGIMINEYSAANYGLWDVN